MLLSKMLFVFPVYLLIVLLPIQIKIGKCEREVINHSSFGEYYMDWKYIGPCENSKGTNEIQMNVKLTKKNKRAQILGNHTFLIPWDESVSMELFYAKLGSNAAWTKNAYLWTLSGCTPYRLLVGEAFLEHMNLPNKCPILKGIYVMKEYDVETIIEGIGPLVPKTFFYGSYKLTSDFKKNDRRVGCTTVVLDIVPKWQRRNKTRHRN